MAQFIIAIVGPAGCGKSAFIERHRSGKYLEKHVEEAGKTTLMFQTNHYGMITFVCVESSDCVPDADAHIIMFDVNPSDFIVDKCPSPKLLCGSKCDIPRSADWITGSLLPFVNKHKIKYREISSKSNYNLDTPFLYLARKLTGHKDLCFPLMIYA